MEIPFEAVLTPLVEEELQTLSQGTSKDAQAAKLALQLIKAQAIKTMSKSSESEAFKNADDELLQVAVKESAFVATQDKELRNRLAFGKVRVIMLRGKQSLVFV